MKRRTRILIITGCVLVALAGVARLIAGLAAAEFGRTVRGMLNVVSVAELGNTQALREYFASPPVSDQLGRIRVLSFVAIDYQVRARELQRGMIYVSEQAALPESQRFSSPPKMLFLQVPTNDRSDRGVAEAMLTLVDSYRSQL